MLLSVQDAKFALWCSEDLGIASDRTEKKGYKMGTVSFVRQASAQTGRQAWFGKMDGRGNADGHGHGHGHGHRNGLGSDSGFGRRNSGSRSTDSRGSSGRARGSKDRMTVTFLLNDMGGSCHASSKSGRSGRSGASSGDCFPVMRGGHGSIQCGESADYAGATSSRQCASPIRMRTARTANIESSGHVEKKDMRTPTSIIKSNSGTGIEKSKSKKGGSHICDICGHSFGMKSNMKRHILTVHEGRRKFECNVCGSLFGLKQNLRTHVKVKHEKHRPFGCEFCGLSFGYKQVLQNHQNSIHGEELRETERRQR